MSGSNIWFISDTHFGHANIIKHCRPQFSNVTEMDESLISKWNASVRPHDLVYHLGDFGWKPADVIRIRPRLNGAIRLIVGNHDSIISLVRTEMFQRIEMWHVFPEWHFTASHVPMLVSQLRHSHFNVHGHVHGNSKGLESYHIEVCVEVTGFKPVHVDEILAKIEERK